MLQLKKKNLPVLLYYYYYCCIRFDTSVEKQNENKKKRTKHMYKAALNIHKFNSNYNKNI